MKPKPRRITEVLIDDGRVARSVIAREHAWDPSVYAVARCARAVIRAPPANPGVSSDAPQATFGDATDAQVRILYIEDNLSNLTLVRRILEREPAVDLMPAMQGTLGLELRASISRR